jgi:DNA-binding MarR family transcriptional regulator
MPDQSVNRKPLSDPGPLLGALLRQCHQSVTLRLAEGFAARGLPPVQPMVTQPLWDAPDGMRLTELAAGAGMTKQSMGELVDQMEQAGYVERVADPIDGRARRVRLTARGRRAGKLARSIVREVQSDWCRRVGAARVRALEATLRAIAELDGSGA